MEASVLWLALVCSVIKAVIGNGNTETHSIPLFVTSSVKFNNEAVGYQGAKFISENSHIGTLGDLMCQQESYTKFQNHFAIYMVSGVATGVKHVLDSLQEYFMTEYGIDYSNGGNCNTWNSKCHSRSFDKPIDELSCLPVEKFFEKLKENKFPLIHLPLDKIFHHACLADCFAAYITPKSGDKELLDKERTTYDLFTKGSDTSLFRQCAFEGKGRGKACVLEGRLWLANSYFDRARESIQGKIKEDAHFGHLNVYKFKEDIKNRITNWPWRLGGNDDVDKKARKEFINRKEAAAAKKTTKINPACIRTHILPTFKDKIESKTMEEIYTGTLGSRLNQEIQQRPCYTEVKHLEASEFLKNAVKIIKDKNINDTESHRQILFSQLLEHLKNGGEWPWKEGFHGPILASGLSTASTSHRSSRIETVEEKTKLEKMFTSVGCVAKCFEDGQVRRTGKMKHTMTVQEFFRSPATKSNAMVCLNQCQNPKEPDATQFVTDMVANSVDIPAKITVGDLHDTIFNRKVLPAEFELN